MKFLTIRNSDSIFIDENAKNNLDEVFYLSESRIGDIKIDGNEMIIQLINVDSEEFAFSIEDFILKNVFSLLSGENKVKFVFTYNH